MKNLIKILLLSTLVLVGQSCSDLLDNAESSTSISPDKALTDPGAVKSLRAGMYNRLFMPTYTTLYMLGPDALADNLTNRAGTNRFGGLASNQQPSGMLDGIVRSGWSISYDIINDANILINGVEKGVLDKGMLNRIQGEAYFMRAFAYHHLVRSLAYEPNQAPSGFTKGVPMITKPTFTKDDAVYKSRSSVKDVYKQIRKDLDKAITKLSKDGSGDVKYATEASAEALYARVELYAQNYGEANTHAKNALSATSAELAQPKQVSLMFDETTGKNPEGIFVTTFDVPNEETGQAQNDALNVYTAKQWLAQVPTQDVMNLYASGDARLSWFDKCYKDDNDEDVSGECPGSNPNVAGGKGLEVQKWNAEQGNYTDNVPLFRVAEMKLIQSEARLKGASGSALQPYKDLRQARGLSASSVNMNNILEERRREYIAEGQRFYDLKRLGKDITKAPKTGLPDVSYDDFRVLDNLPFSQVSQSQAQAPEGQKMEQNPGYNQ